MKKMDDLKSVLFEPGGGPVDSRANRSSDVPRMTSGRAALVGLMDCYVRGLLDPFVTLLEVHKLMYFMQVAGEPLRLKFVKATYGPYAENLRHVLNAIEGHLVYGYADGGDAPDKELELVPGRSTMPMRFSKTHLKRRRALKGFPRSLKGSSRRLAWNCSLRCIGSPARRRYWILTIS
ncbi:MAG: hypothetical protein F4X51_11185 [Gemmatimonadetes bacterium]|nr:hypothetical protein [Gemmatimonadota bacterium]